MGKKAEADAPASETSKGLQENDGGMIYTEHTDGSAEVKFATVQVRRRRCLESTVLSDPDKTCFVFLRTGRPSLRLAHGACLSPRTSCGT